MKAIQKPSSQPIPPRRLYTTKEVAKLWNISKCSIYKLVPLGKLRPIINIGKGWMWTGEELGNDGPFDRL
jgi:hypothetical protein